MTETDLPNSKPNKHAPETTRIGEDRIVQLASMDFVTDEARAEVAELKASGVDVEMVDINMNGHYELSEDKQRLVTQAIEAYSAIPNFADLLSEASPAVAGWHGMAKSMSPLALTFFYNMGSMNRPSDGLSKHAILHKQLPITGGGTATQIVRRMKDKKNADEILSRTEAFFEAGSLKDNVDEFGLTPHDIMAGSLDRIGDITRAITAIDIVDEHISESFDSYQEKGLVTASLACGAAEPVYWLIDRLRKRGMNIDTAHLVDLDPIALAASADRSKHYDLEDKISMHHNDLLRGPSLDTYIDPKSVDVVDLIGIVEYLSPVLAKMLLQNAATIVKPGGIMVFGNMLKSRPQQKWFEGLWPRLRQRSMAEVIKIVEDAGFSRDQLIIRLPKDGLYPIYGIKIPNEQESDTSRAVNRVARGLGRVASPDFL